MFHQVDKIHIIDFDPFEEQQELFNMVLPRWAYINSEWVAIVMWRTKLSGLTEWYEKSRKKELSYDVVYLENDFDTIFGE